MRCLLMSLVLSGRRLSLLAACITFFAVGVTHVAAQETLKIQPGDHISIIGNTLADRMQHDGWLETYFYSRFPKDNLSFRNLGFSGDELTLRLRSPGCG